MSKCWLKFHTPATLLQQPRRLTALGTAMAAAALVAVAVLSLAGDASAAGLGKNVTPFAEKLFGTYTRKPGIPGKAILGPLAFDFLPSMSILRDPATDDVWWTLLSGQMWHTVGNETQYCFGPASTKKLAEQSPFSIDSVSDSSVNLCWRRGLRGMPTQKANCSGCDCARILMNLTDPDTLRFQFWMSPPVLHADVQFVRSGPPRTFQQAIESTMDNPYDQCDIRDHYGPNVPGEPDLRTTPPPTAARTSGCADAVRETMAMSMKDDDVVLQTQAGQAVGADLGDCYQLNCLNFALDSATRWDPKKAMGVPDVKIQFTTPAKPCDPCDVAYSVSAKIEDDEYIAAGFKGRSWERDFPYAPEHPLRPCYFGMCVDSFDNFTSDRIALGYTAQGGCVREMEAKYIVGAPTDVDYKILKGTSVERTNGRTVLHFTVSQHWQWDHDNLIDGPWRIMWAIGKTSPAASNETVSACTATLGYHAERRGVAPLKWLAYISATSMNSCPCSFSDNDVAGVQPVFV